MISRSKAGAGIAFALSFSFFGCSALPSERTVPSWSPSSDLAYYEGMARANPSSGDVSQFAKHLAVAMRTGGYLAHAVDAASRRCDAWIALQLVDVNALRYELSFFCRSKVRGWSVIAATPSDYRVIEEVNDSSGQRVDALLMRIPSASGVNYRTAFDGEFMFLTSFWAGKVDRVAVYAPDYGEQVQEDTDFAEASSLVLEALALSKVASK